MCETKICSKCNLDKKLSEFSFRKDSKDGYRGYCKVCESDQKKLYRDNDIVKERNENWRKNNPDKVKKHVEKYAENNADSISKYRESYAEINKNSLNQVRRARYKIRIETDLLYKLRLSYSVSVRSSFKRKKLTKNCKSYNLLGCSFEEFKLFIESKFESWMNWENYGKYKKDALNYGWDIDHIIPSSSATNEDELIKLNHYTNLQPLCSYTNRVIKRAKENY